MGMVDDAIRELEPGGAIAAPPVRGIQPRGTAAPGAGQLAAAVEWFERAAEAPAPTPDAGRELLFELGQTLEAADETARALAVYLELRSDAGEFRDVSSRIQRLTRAQAEG